MQKRKCHPIAKCSLLHVWSTFFLLVDCVLLLANSKMSWISLSIRLCLFVDSSSSAAAAAPYERKRKKTKWWWRQRSFGDLFDVHISIEEFHFYWTNVESLFLSFSFGGKDCGWNVRINIQEQYLPITCHLYQLTVCVHVFNMNGKIIDKKKIKYKIETIHSNSSACCVRFGRERLSVFV